MEVGYGEGSGECATSRYLANSHTGGEWSLAAVPSRLLDMDGIGTGPALSRAGVIRALATTLGPVGVTRC